MKRQFIALKQATVSLPHGLRTHLFVFRVRVYHLFGLTTKKSFSSRAPIWI